MIIGIDGCVATGKTTLAQTLGGGSYQYLPEYAVDRIAIPQSPWERQSQYLAAERDRPLPVGDVVVDRTLVSQAAHVYASTGLADPLRRMFVRYIRAKGVAVWGVVPTSFVMLLDDAAGIRLRLALRESSPQRMGTEAILASEEYISRFQEYLNIFLDVVPSDCCFRFPACPDPNSVIGAVGTGRSCRPSAGELNRALLVGLSVER